ncbi:MAG: intradiol ring-cleavage dioxygenase [Geminicoccaceae bacterium]
MRRIGHVLGRRRFLGVSAGLASISAMPACAAGLSTTPAQAEGPFYPLDLPLDHDSDLTRVEGRNEGAAGTVLDLGGRVLGADGRPVSDVRVEIWQCDALGVYHHPGDRRGPGDPNFQGFGQTIADDEGGYRFRTIVPVAYPGRTPHIHFKILGADVEALTTQMYVAGNPDNARDGLYRRLGRASELVTVPLQPDGGSGGQRALFDIVLGPDGVTTSG